MALNRDDLLIQISSDTASAVKGLKDVEAALHGLKGHAQGAEESLTGFGFAALKINEGLELAKKAAEALGEVWEKTVGRFHEAQDGVLKLSGAISIMGGKDVPGATARMLEFADSIQASTVVGKEQVINLLETAKAAGQSDEASRKMVKTAIDMAASGILPVNEALRGQIMTLKGQGRAVGEASVFLQGLTEDQLKAGVGLDVLAKRFDGFAKVQASTFTGAMQQVRNEVSEIFVKLGEILVKGLKLDQGGNALKDFVLKVKEELDKLAPTIIDMLRTVRAAVDGVIGAIAKIDFAGLAREAQIFIAAIGLLASPAIAAALAPIVVELGTMAASFIAAAAPAIALVAAITGVGIAVDLIVRNMDRLPDLAKTFGDAFVIAFNAIEKGFLELMQYMIVGIEKLVTILGQTFPSQFGSAAVAVNESAAKMFDGIADKISSLTGETKLAFEDLAEDSKGLDFGLAGKLKDQLTNIVANFKKAFKASAEATGETKGPKLPTGAAPEPEKFRSKFRLFTDDDIKEIKAAFGPSAGGFASSVTTMTQVPLGMLGAANMFLDAAQKLVDAGPQLLEKVAHLIDSLTDLPTKLADAFQHIFTAIMRNITQGIPKLASMFERLNDMAADFLAKLPDALIGLMQKLPQLVNHFIDKLPGLARKLIPVMIAGIPRIVAQLTKSFLSDGPKIAHEIIRVVMKDLPPALREAFKEAINEMRHMFDDVKIPDLGIGDQMKSLGDSVQKQSSKLFEVIDANSANVGNNTAKAISEAIDGAVNRAVGLLRALWNALRDLWLWVWTKVLQPIIDALTKAWMWVKTNILDPLNDLVMKAWKWVVDNVLSPIFSVVQKAWQWTIDHVVTPLATIGRDAYQWVVDKIVTPLASAGQAGFKWVVDNVITPLNSIGAAGFQWVVDHIVKPLGDAGHAFYDGLSKAMNDNVQFFRDIGGKVWEGLWKGISDNIAQIQNAFKISVPGVSGGGGGGGVIGKILGHASGGMIYMAGGGAFARGNDQVPFMGEQGEFVIRRRAVNAIGPGVLNAINQTGQLPGSGAQNVHLDVGGITVNHNGERLDAAAVRDKIVPALMKEIKKASTEGRFVMSPRGLRNV